MNKRWWEDPVIVLVDYWPMWLGLLVLLLVGFFTRSYWLPMLGIQSNEMAPIATLVVSVPKTSTSLPIPTSVVEAQPTVATTIVPTSVATMAATDDNLEEKPEKGYLAPKVTAKTESGQKINSTDYQGKPIFIYVFASWCSFCQEEAPLVETMYQKYQDKGLVVLAVNNTSNDKVSDVKIFASKYNWTFKPLYDETGSIMTVYNLTGTPGNVFIDKHGVINNIVLGNMTETQLDQSIKGIVE